MTGSSAHPTSITAATAPDGRLSLKSPTPISGYVDGAWWPGSLDLAAEVPVLAAQLADRWGAVDRVSYDLAAWMPAPRQVMTSDRRIRLDGFRGRRPTDAVHISGGWRPALTLLVIPPATETPAARATLRRAAENGNQDSIDDLLQRETPSSSTGSDHSASYLNPARSSR